MTRYRPFRNDDPPALAKLWNAGLPERNVVQPLGAHAWDALVAGKPYFEADGLIVAEHDGRIAGYVHVGFGPVEPNGPSHRLDRSLGTIAMLALEPGLDDAIGDGLVREAERRLRRRGAAVLYAGGAHPLDPFYWGIYGGSEFAGVLDGHESFRRILEHLGYEPASRSILLEFPLDRGEPRDPKLAMLRRQVRLEVVDGAESLGWWASLALGPFRPASYTLVGKADDRPIARATTWELASDLVGGPNRTGLIGVEVAPEFRRKGFGRLLIVEILRQIRGQMAEVACVQTHETNEAALALYEGIGFERVEASTLYRLPAALLDRPVG